MKIECFGSFFFAHWISVFFRITHNCYHHFGQSQMYTVIVIPKDGLTSVLKKETCFNNKLYTLSFIVMQANFNCSNFGDIECVVRLIYPAATIWEICN